MRVALATVVVLVVGWLLIPLARAYATVAPARHDVGAPPWPDADSVTFSSSPELSAWIWRAAIGAPAVVLVHGFRSDRREMRAYAEFLHGGGYTVLLLDTRACGASGGSAVGIGATEPRDISAAVDLAYRGGARRVGVLGISLGAGAAILAAAADPSIAAVVADSAWTDQDLALDRLHALTIGPLRIPLPPYGESAVDALVGARVRDARPLEAIARASAPVLLIHARDDGNATTPPAGSEALARAAAKAELWLVERGGHAGAIRAFPDEYRTRVLAFFDRALR